MTGHQVVVRCDRHRHFHVVGPDAAVEIRCRWCSAAEGREVFHRWPLADLAHALTLEHDIVAPAESEASATSGTAKPAA